MQTDRQLYQRIWSLTWPMMVANALELGVGLFDLWLVRPFGPSATAAIGVVRQVTFLVEALAVVITTGAITLVSQGVGASARRIPAGLRAEPAEVVRQSLALLLLMGLPTALAGYFLSGPVLICLQTSDQTRAFGEPYLHIYFAGLLFVWGNLVGTALFRGAGDVWTPLKVAVVVSLFQVGLSYLLIYGAGPVPAFGVPGAALGGVTARAAGVLVFLFLLQRGTAKLRPPWTSLRRLDWKLLGSMLRIGVPMALANVLRHGSRVVFLALAGASILGESMQAAVGVALQVRQIAILTALAFQVAGATLVGQAIGRGDLPQAEMLGRRSVRLLALLMGILSAILFVLAEPLAQLFQKAPQVAGLNATVLRWFAVAQLFSALSIATQGVLMGAGDTVPAMLYTLLSEWCLLLPLSGILVAVDWVPDGLLAAWVLAPVLTFTLMQWRFRSGRWKVISESAHNNP